MKLHIINMQRWSEVATVKQERGQISGTRYTQAALTANLALHRDPNIHPIGTRIIPISSQRNPSSRARDRAGCGGSYIDICSLRDEVLHHILLTKVGGIVQGYPPRTLIHDPVDVIRLQKSNTMNATKIYKEHTGKKNVTKGIWGVSFFWKLKNLDDGKNQEVPSDLITLQTTVWRQRVLHSNGLTEWIWMHEQLSGEFKCLQQQHLVNHITLLHTFLSQVFLFL